MQMQAIQALLRPTPDLGHEVKRCNRLRVASSIATVPVVLLLALLTAESESARLHMRTLGALALAAGVGLRFWALGNIDGRKKRMLVTWGAYSRVRHPLYLGSLLIVIGFCILAGSWSAAVLAGFVFLALYLPAVHAEERLLAAQFGAAWESYCRHSWAFLPRLGRRREAVRMPFRFRRPWREIGVLVLLFLGVLGASELMWALRRRFDLAGWLL